MEATYPKVARRPTADVADLQAQLADPAFSQQAGFPRGATERILERSSPPYYTACPNPFMEALVSEWRARYPAVRDAASQTDAPQVAPNRLGSPTFVPSTKTGSSYLLHTYHSKIPPSTLASLIHHHCMTGDVILDPFAGSGMTGVAAQMVAHQQGKPLFCIQNDLSPAATFIANSYAQEVDAIQLQQDGADLLASCRAEFAALYSDDGGAFDYTIFSDIFICTDCGKENIFWDIGVDRTTWTFRKPFQCHHCALPISKRRTPRKRTTYMDPLLGQPVTQALQLPVARKRGRKLDLLTVKQRDAIWDDPALFCGNHVPIVPLRAGANLSQPQRSHGISHIHHLFTWRNLQAFSLLWNRAAAYPSAQLLHFTLTSFMLKTGSKLHNIGLKNGSINLAGQLPNTYYIPNLTAERNVGQLFAKKLDQVVAYFTEQKTARTSRPPQSSQQPCATVATSTGSAINLPLADNSVDYCITDPPFGGFVNYAELNLVWEAWLGLHSAHDDEAIISTQTGKDHEYYQAVMGKAFAEIHRVLKPGSWLTLVFHNSSNQVWQLIQEALVTVGFVVADVCGMGRGQGSYKQMTATVAVKTDLLVSAYKPHHAETQAMPLRHGNRQEVWTLIRNRLRTLPPPQRQHEGILLDPTRQNYQLFDYMVAHHIQQGLTIPLSAAEFYAGLDDHFVCQDGMYFLKDQIV